MPPVRLDEEAQNLLINYHWPGNVRQLKNITEQISVIEQNRELTADVLRNYLPSLSSNYLPALLSMDERASYSNEREILYKVLFDMKHDMNDLKKLVLDLIKNREAPISGDHARIIQNLYDDNVKKSDTTEQAPGPFQLQHIDKNNIQDTEEVVEESLSLEEKEIELIEKALGKHNGKRKYAAAELGISERTLYRKIKEYNIER